MIVWGSKHASFEDMPESFLFRSKCVIGITPPIQWRWFQWSRIPNQGDAWPFPAFQEPYKDLLVCFHWRLLKGSIRLSYLKIYSSYVAFLSVSSHMLILLSLRSFWVPAGPLPLALQNKREWELMNERLKSPSKDNLHVATLRASHGTVCESSHKNIPARHTSPVAFAPSILLSAGL